MQLQVATRVLSEFLDAWKMNIEAAHKKNKIAITQGHQESDRPL
jgi:hypothetical protein